MKINFNTANHHKDLVYAIGIQTTRLGYRLISCLNSITKKEILLTVLESKSEYYEILNST